MEAVSPYVRGSVVLQPDRKVSLKNATASAGTATIRRMSNDFLQLGRRLFLAYCRNRVHLLRLPRKRHWLSGRLKRVNHFSSIALDSITSHPYYFNSNRPNSGHTVALLVIGILPSVT